MSAVIPGIPYGPDAAAISGLLSGVTALSVDATSSRFSRLSSASFFSTQFLIWVFLAVLIQKI